MMRWLQRRTGRGKESGMGDERGTRTERGARLSGLLDGGWLQSASLMQEGTFVRVRELAFDRCPLHKSRARQSGGAACGLCGVADKTRGLGLQ